MKRDAIKPELATSRALTWWATIRDAWQRQREAQNLAEADLLASELGVTVDDFHRLATTPGGRSELLGRRLAGLGLSPDDILALSPLLLRDLERTCACCAVKDQCAADMKISAVAIGWESYCPNSGTLRTLA